MRTLRKHVVSAAAACVVGLGGLSAAPAHAELIQLGFILDSSGSINYQPHPNGWSTMTNGLAQAMDLLLNPGVTDTFEVTVVKFSTTAQTVLAPTVVTSTNLASVKSTISGATFMGNTTNYDAAFSLMKTQLTGSTNFTAGGKSYVNFATDGEPNACGSSGTNATTADAWTCGVTAANALVTAGIDNISIEGIGTTNATASSLQSNICYPTPCDTTSPYNFATKGFFIAVANPQGYADAIGNKVRIVTGQDPIPEPASLALVGLALAGLAVSRRASRKA